MAIYLGIDPGFADAGYGVISQEGNRECCLVYGSIKTLAGTPMPARLATIYKELSEVIIKYKPESVGIEKLFFAKNVTTAMSVAEARGVIRLCVEQHGLPCREFSPAEVKLAVCGNGAAEKRDVQKMVRLLLGLDHIPQPDDAADALAIAITAAHTKQLVR